MEARTLTTRPSLSVNAVCETAFSTVKFIYPTVKDRYHSSMLKRLFASISAALSASPTGACAGQIASPLQSASRLRQRRTVCLAPPLSPPLAPHAPSRRPCSAEGTLCAADMGYDDVLTHLGDFGRYQRRIYLLLCLPAIVCALHKMSGVFLQARVDHRCRLPGEDDNASYWLSDDVLNSSLPWDPVRGQWSSCLRLDDADPSRALPCDDGWIYDPQRTTAVSEWDLVCQRDWLRPTADACVMTGVLVGAVVFGALSDRFGRRPVFFGSLVLQVVVGLLAAVSPVYVLFLILRFIVGATTSGVFLVAYVIAMEMVGPNKRLVAGVGCQLFFTVGYMLSAAFAKFITDWRILQAAMAGPGLLFLVYYWFIPESARWLLTKGRTEEARAVLQRAAKENRVTLPTDTLASLLPQEDGSGKKVVENASLFDMMRYPNMRRRSLNIFFNWFANNITYYGLSWNTASLGGDMYLNFLISGAVEIPAYMFLLLTLNRWGRKTILCGSMLVGAGVLLFTTFVPEDMTWLRITLVMLGKLAITASYGTVYVFTTEQFPTVIRNAALGASSMCARVGGIIAPYINLLGNIWPVLPQLVYGGMTLTAGLLALLLPETMNKTLPDTIAEGENFGLKPPPLGDPEIANGIERVNGTILKKI